MSREMRRTHEGVWPRARTRLHITNSCRCGRVRALALRFAPGHAFGTSGNFERYRQAEAGSIKELQFEKWVVQRPLVADAGEAQTEQGIDARL